MKKILILNEDQLDFVTGSMSVKKKGKEAVEKTKVWINRNKENIEKVIFICTFNSPNSKLFKCNGGEYPRFCIEHTPGACIEPTILKLLWRLNIPYEITTSWDAIEEIDNIDLVVAGMNGNTGLYSLVREFWNVKKISLFWPGTYFFKHDEQLFKWLREHTEGIFEVPKRDKKKDLFVQKIKG